MCDLVIERITEEVLNEKVAKKEVFTSYDITKDVRLKVFKICTHRDVKKVVVNRFFQGQIVGYVRKACVLNTNDNVRAFVYYPSGKTPSEHPLVDGNKNDEVDNDPDDGIIVSAKSEGRVNIPHKVLNQISPTNDIYEFSVNGKLVSRKRNANGMIRLGLKSYGISGGKCRMTVDNDTIMVEQV